MGDRLARLRSPSARLLLKRNDPTMQTRRAHPHFDDKGALDWHTRWSEALATAKRENKHLFIEFGREQ